MTSFDTVADTGFVVTLLNHLDIQHEPVKAIYEQASQPILLPQTTLAEVAYLGWTGDLNYCLDGGL